ncbi:unnamed protein product [Leuciscus chuanchicus]
MCSWPEYNWHSKSPQPASLFTVYRANLLTNCECFLQSRFRSEGSSTSKLTQDDSTITLPIAFSRRSRQTQSHFGKQQAICVGVKDHLKAAAQADNMSQSPGHRVNILCYIKLAFLQHAELVNHAVFPVRGGEGRTMYSKLFSSKMSKCSFSLKASDSTESLDLSCAAALQLHETSSTPLADDASLITVPIVRSLALESRFPLPLKPPPSVQSPRKKWEKKYMFVERATNSDSSVISNPITPYKITCLITKARGVMRGPVHDSTHWEFSRRRTFSAHALLQKDCTIKEGVFYKLIDASVRKEEKKSRPSTPLLSPSTRINPHTHTLSLSSLKTRPAEHRVGCVD